MIDRVIRRIGLVGSAGALAVAAGLSPAQASGPVRPSAVPDWRPIANIMSLNTRTFLNSVETSAPREAWAAGFSQIEIAPGQSRLVPAIETWNGTAWTGVDLPPGLKIGNGPQYLDAVSASGPHNVWIDSDAGHWLHYDGTTWTTGVLPDASEVSLLSSLAVSTTNQWAFGGTGAGPVLKPYAARNTGSGWKRTAVPGTGAIVGVSAVTGTDIWAVMGTGFESAGIQSPTSGLVRWYAGAWHAGPALPASMHNSALGAILARSDTNVWVGGAAKNSEGGYTEAIAHWNGHAWSVVKLPVPATTTKWHVNSIVPDGSGGLWALGNCIGNCVPHKSRLWHEVGGRWTSPEVPSWEVHNTALNQLAATGHSVWGAGSITDGSFLGGLIALWGPVPS